MPKEPTKKKRAASPPGHPYSWGAGLVASGYWTEETLAKAVAAGDIRPDPLSVKYGDDAAAIREAHKVLAKLSASCAKHKLTLAVKTK